MINKEEKKAIEYVKAQKGIYYKTVINLIQKQENRIKELEEINEEHQELNGELQKKVTYYEEICKGKTIQELGMSDLYKED